MIDDKFDNLMAELKREEAIKSDAITRTSTEFESTVNGLVTQLKTLDSDNERSLRNFAEGFKKEATSIFDTIKAENDSIDASEAKVQTLVKEVIDRSAVGLLG